MVSGWIISGPRGGDRRYLKLRCFSGSAHDLGVESRLNLLKGIFIFSAWKVAREGTTGRKKNDGSEEGSRITVSDTIG